MIVSPIRSTYTLRETQRGKEEEGQRKGDKRGKKKEERGTG